MPNQIYKLSGDKIVPLNRFNLEPAKLSNIVNTNNSNTKPAFSVVAHPVLNSIAIKPEIISNLIFKEYFPLIEDTSKTNQTSIFQDYYDKTISLQFPEIDITPLNNNQIFYYENIFNNKGEVSGSLGRVTINYVFKFKPTTTTLKNIPILLKQVQLNLNIKDNVVKIEGKIDENKKEITFELKDEAVKYAFTNLITNFNELKSSIDFFFNFKGYSKTYRPLFFAAFNTNHINLSKINTENLSKKSMISQPLVLNENKILKTELKNTKINNAKLEPSFTRNTFILKIKKVLNYPLGTDKNSSFYKTVDGGFINNPFNFNQDFSLYEQIFVPGINLDKLSIYKSNVTPNEFLLIAKRYHITRTKDTNAPCINTVFHGVENDAGLINDISKVSFQFALGPDLSDFDLNKLKIDLFRNNFLDGDTSNYFEKIKFIYPNDLQDTTTEIFGNQYLSNANVTHDGKYILIDSQTEKLNEASILINSFNNCISQYANINFMHKEIKDTSIIELNIQKTIGEIVTYTMDNNIKSINIKNNSISPCKIHAALTIDNVFNPLINSSFFNNFLLNSEEEKLINYNQINTALATKNIEKVFFEIESIEDVTKEFKQIVATSNNFIKYITVQIQTQKTTTAKVQIELTVRATGGKFNLERLKADFKTPFLINFLLNNNSDSTMEYKVNYFDKDNNILISDANTFDFNNSSILNIIKK